MAPVVPSRSKFIYITGCDSGFGSILTRKLDELGFGVIPGCYLAASIPKIKAERSKFVFPIQVDVSNEASVVSAAEQIKTIVSENNGVLHGIVNNAGILVQPGPTEWTNYDAYRRMFDVNVMGTVMTTKTLLPLIRKSQGRIINVASIAGRIGLLTEPAYCASKYAVEGYSEVLRKDMYVWGVTVHIIEPGVFKATGLYDKFVSGAEELWESQSDEIKKAYGTRYFKNLQNGLKGALSQGSPQSELVVDAMIDALTSANPKYRYKVGNDSKYIISFLEKTHESVQDGIMNGHYLRPVNTPATAPQNGVAIADGRYHKAWARFLIAVGGTAAVGTALIKSAL